MARKTYNLSEDKIKVPQFKEGLGFFTSKKYSKIMSKIQPNSGPEVLLRKKLWSLGIRYRLRDKTIEGKPDLIIRKFKLLIFVDGDFWHGYDWESRKPKLKTNTSYWIPKIERNIQRDLEINKVLVKNGWRVVRLWEHEVKNNIEECIARIQYYCSS